MDSQDSTAQPSHLTHLHHPHRPLPLPPSHPAGVLLGPHSQSQQRLPSDSYPLANSNNAVNPTTTVMHQQNPGFPFNSILAGGGPKPEDHLQPDQSSSGGRGDGSGSVPPRKRGRPPGPSGASASKTPSDMVRDDSAASGASGGTPSSGTPSKRRGRPPGPAKKQLDALGPAGVGFTAHVITINAEEDIPSKIMAYCEVSRTVCVISARGAVKNVTLCRPALSGGTGTYEYPGLHVIITLSGSYTVSEMAGNVIRSGSLNISVIGRDGNVIGGRVGGNLKAAAEVEVIIGIFISAGGKPETGKGRSPSLGGPSGSAAEKPLHDVDVK